MGREGHRRTLRLIADNCPLSMLHCWAPAFLYYGYQVSELDFKK